jgi:uncharacterized protein (TIGR03118 family)
MTMALSQTVRARTRGDSLRFVEPLEQRRLLSGGPDGSGDFFTQTNLVSNTPDIPAAHHDAHLQNAWGISFGPTTPFWISDNGAGVATLYDGNGVAQPPPPAAQRVVTMTPTTAGGQAAPTGQVFNTDSTAFKVSAPGKAPAASIFIFASEDGGITGWNPGVDNGHALFGYNGASTGAVYKGLAEAKVGTASFLYAADFHNAQITVLDGTFTPVTWAGAFHDSDIPAGFAPFNVQNLGGNLFVTYAKQDPTGHDDVAGPGNGFVDEYSPSGQLLMQFKHTHSLNSPWGLAQAPADWGKFSGDLLVGNFGSGQIAAFDPTHGNFRGLLRGATGKPVTIDGLWGLAFGNNNATFDTHKLYFTAGPNDEADGLLGNLALTQRPADGNPGDKHDKDNGDHKDQNDDDADAGDLLDNLTSGGKH